MPKTMHDKTYTDNDCIGIPGKSCHRKVAAGNRFRCEVCAVAVDDLLRLHPNHWHHIRYGGHTLDAEILRQKRWEADMEFVSTPDEPKVSYLKVYGDYAHDQYVLWALVNGCRQPRPQSYKREPDKWLANAGIVIRGNYPWGYYRDPVNKIR